VPAPFSVAACQTDVYPYFPDESYTPHPEHFEKNLARACELVSYHARGGARLFLFSEFFLSGSPAGQSAEVYRQVAIRIPGPEIEELAAVARKRRVYIAGMAYEKDDENWPGRFFNTGFILDPDGQVILRYRKHYDETCKTKPGDVMDRYLELHGIDELFPVVDTEIGKLAIQQAYDINYPEVSRCFALQGAEVLLFATSEINSRNHMYGVGGWANARRVRAYENIAYLVCANEAWFLGTARPNAWPAGHSEVIDYNGQVLNVADTMGETIISAEVDLEALRRRRTTVGMNFLAQAQPHLFAEVLRRTQAWPKNAWADTPPPSGREMRAMLVDTIGQMQAAGTLARPGS
jgi:predicted amidohydrolase